MRVWKDVNLRDFNFWSGGADRAKLLTAEELDKIEEYLEVEYPEGIKETELNDLFWFDFKLICELIGETEESVFKREQI